nr:zinc finger BED domain-containing protein RICESLEEPER 2-like [Tanacetum cinerariifolium]
MSCERHVRGCNVDWNRKRKRDLECENGPKASANSLAWATHQLSNGNSFALTVAKYSSSGIFIANSGNALEHFIPNIQLPSINMYHRVVESSPVEVSCFVKDGKGCTIVLAIPISTVASEATFSAGGRVIDPYRSALKSNTVEMLLCGGDWIRQSYVIKRKLRYNGVVEQHAHLQHV